MSDKDKDRLGMFCMWLILFGLLGYIAGNLVVIADHLQTLTSVPFGLHWLR